MQNEEIELKKQPRDHDHSAAPEPKCPVGADLPETIPKSMFWGVTISAALVLMVTMGIRSSLGLFITPLNEATGLGIATFSFALAMGQFFFGITQPFAGALAKSVGSTKVLFSGVVLMTLGFVLAPFVLTNIGVTFTLGVMLSAGSGVTSLSVLIGSAVTILPVASRSMFTGVANAGGSLGQFVFAPIIEELLTSHGYKVALIASGGFVLCSAVFVLMSHCLTRRLAARGKPADPSTSESLVDHSDETCSEQTSQTTSLTHSPPNSSNLRTVLKLGLTDRSYVLTHLAFFTCGFHVAFLQTHIPGEVESRGFVDASSIASWCLAIIGLANVAGSLSAGWLIGPGGFRARKVLFCLYLSRAVLVLTLLLAPNSELLLYSISIGFGVTYLATVTPTVDLVSKRLGVRHIGAMFGLTLVSHQFGGFLGAYIGGVVRVRNSSLEVAWYVDMVLCVAAAFANLPIKEELHDKVQE
mmetsp:Transcript_47136/g.92770  ORF Transcript_47136/g.92770 Transcript_47136/m.92770 type:complete len:470 (-) Transcript_47136:612-2021(-)